MRNMKDTIMDSRSFQKMRGKHFGRRSGESYQIVSALPGPKGACHPCGIRVGWWIEVPISFPYVLECANNLRPLFFNHHSHALAVQERLKDFYIPNITSITHEGKPVEPPRPIPWYP